MLALIDCNNFFVSCERLFRPDLIGKPVVVLSSNDGCIISRSEEAKALGIKMGEPHFKVRDLCEKHAVAVFSSNFDLYRDLSRRVMSTLRRFSDEVEVYSVDEAFLSIPLLSTTSTSLPSSCGSSPYSQYDSAPHSSTPRIWGTQKRSRPATDLVRHCLPAEASAEAESNLLAMLAQARQAGPGVWPRTSNNHWIAASSPCGTPPRNDETLLFTVGSLIRATVLREVGIPVSVGIAPTKTLAKVATYFAKHASRTYGNAYGNGDGRNSHEPTTRIPHTGMPRMPGVCVLMDEEERACALDVLPIEEVWGVGFRLTPQLKHLGIDTAGKLVAMDDAWIHKKMSIRGLRTVEELRGKVCFEVGEDSELRKSLLHSQSFGKPLRDLPNLRAAVAYHARKVAETLRAEGAAARNVHVTIRTSRHGQERYAASDTDTLPTHTNNTLELVSQALAILTRIYRPGFPYAKAGVMVTDIVPEGAVHPTTLFGTSPNAMQPLMRAMDELRHRYGADVLRLGVEGKKSTWTARHTRLSPRYTTDWKEVPKIEKCKT